MILWYFRNFLFTIKYKLGLVKPCSDLPLGYTCCFCENMVDCPEDCGICPFYHPEGF